ncbi:MAG: amidophosphoribosyltransferase [Alphaproteobacteria bacterium]|jgi:amidophosphoribosyltransferase|nr:amidophosphoribosyltransferase [Alphaproteobacteria bacterium]MBT5827524.1 amidophosphoribosyltransferase [Alphaproteobacteria bacterium]
MYNTDELNLDTLHEECGVCGIYGGDDAASLTALGLHALQHRGQEAAGIITYDQDTFHKHHDTGHVGDIFNDSKIIDDLPGNISIGHVRYSTAGSKNSFACQPIFAELDTGGIALAHNGNLTNALTLKNELVKTGSIFNSTMDTEVILHLIAKSNLNKVADKIIDALKKVEGAYSIVAIADNALFAIRDPHGIRPLALGKINDAYIVASESCAFDIIGAEFIRDIEAGEMLVINNEGVNSYRPFEEKPNKFCIFEYIYFARPDSVINKKHVYEVRKNIGRILANESSVDADVVVPVPDSGVPSALGYALEAKLPFEFGIIRNHYVGRTFIEPTDNVRNFGVKLKHNANRAVLKNKRIILVDDSIVRGTTSKKIVDMIRSCGAKEVHMRISSPPTTHSCFYGVDTPDRKKLIAANHNIDEIAKIIGVDSLAYISLDGLYKATGNKERNSKQPQYCDACFSGEYPINLEDKQNNKLPLLDNI